MAMKLPAGDPRVKEYQFLCNRLKYLRYNLRKGRMGVTLEKAKKRHLETVPRLIELNKQIRQLYPDCKLKPIDRAWLDWDERPINVSSRQRRENRVIYLSYRARPITMPEGWSAAVEPQDVEPVKMAVASEPPPDGYWGDDPLGQAMAELATGQAAEQQGVAGPGWAGLG